MEQSNVEQTLVPVMAQGDVSVPKRQTNVKPWPISPQASHDVLRAYEDAVIGLLSSKPFFAKLLMTVRKDFRFHLPTLAVSVCSTAITLHVHPDVFMSLTRSERQAILVHEMLHLMHGHLHRFRFMKVGDQGLANIACDVAIDQYIQGLPSQINIINHETGEVIKGQPVTFQMLKAQIPDLEPYMSAEYYFDKMKQAGMSSKDMEQVGAGNRDDHGEWQESDLTEEQQERLTKGHVKAVLDTCSASDKECLDKSLIEEFYKSSVDWKAQLRQFLAQSEETFTYSTRKRRNRRYGILQPGNRTESKLNLVIAVDTSGSMSDESLKLVFGEIDRIFDPEKNVVHVIEADCVIHQVYKYQKGMKISAQGRGGTAYQSAFNKAQELKADAFIYMGDMDSSDTPTKPRFSTLWAIVGGQKPPADFGRAIYIE